MDKLESLSTQLSQITMYDIKSMYNQAKNIVLNVSEVEALVAEATNDEPWGASSTLMQNIANNPEFNEIMPAIYTRFMEKEARQWRQIYKALQLLEYLVKNGSERVVDDARSHLSTIKMLRSFHYIDDKGKDQGLNVRNRSRELAELLSDVEKIRSERRKAKANKNKYVGTGNDGLSFSSGGSRYGGFGSDSLGGGYSGSGFSGGYSGSAGYSGSSGGFASSSSAGFRDDTSRRGFEEYDAGADEESARPARSSSVRSAATSSRTLAQERRQTAPPAPKQPEPVVDLLGGFDDEPTPAAPPANNQNKALPALGGGGDDDDFADFQAAPTTPAPASAAPAAAKPNLMDLLNSTPATASAPASAAPMASPPAYGQQSFGAYGMGMGQPAMGMGYGAAQQPQMGMGMGMQPQAMG
ncbi:hypothetical protein HDZ31DRAFT_24540, partial [Schizophyllum fasciatum]